MREDLPMRYATVAVYSNGSPAIARLLPVEEAAEVEKHPRVIPAVEPLPREGYYVLGLESAVYVAHKPR